MGEPAWGVPSRRCKRLTQRRRGVLPVDALAVPAQRDLLPEAVAGDPDCAEGLLRNSVEGRDVQGDAEAFGERRTVPPVPVEKLDHSHGVAEGVDALLDSLAHDRIEYPDLPVHRDRVRAALHPVRLRCDPAEAPFLLVAEADAHQAARAESPSRSSITRAASGLESIRT